MVLCVRGGGRVSESAKQGVAPSPPLSPFISPHVDGGDHAAWRVALAGERAAGKIGCVCRRCVAVERGEPPAPLPPLSHLSTQSLLPGWPVTVGTATASAATAASAASAGRRMRGSGEGDCVRPTLARGARTG